ncbi:Translation initiation factor 3 subunit J component [Coemansia erecta]|uniref:Eukaryotic translation initiation factor 3 subunit J n=1 Tax=Coemansia erecta TaxID=147472 RepID=A0A9W8CRD0_9FUNG|nr:Translation initiation factor 3 subunit J component [Coemansia erecta]
MVITNDEAGISKKKWEDEDASDDESVASDWDVSSEEEEEEEQEPAPKSAPAPKPKAKAAAKVPSDDESEEDEDDETAKRLRDRKLQQEADLKNAEDLFAGLTIKDTNINNVLATMNPKTQAEFDEFRKALVERITKAQNSRLYNQFIEKLVRDLADPLKDHDVRKLASGLTTLANEKQRAAREATKPKKKNKKATLSAPPKDQMDMADYSRDAFDDYDDFM